MFGISVFHNFVAAYILCLLAYSVLGLGNRYLLMFNRLTMTESFVLNQEVTDRGDRPLSNFHIKEPHFNLINSPRGRISSCLNRGSACSLLFLESMVLTAFLFEIRKQLRFVV